MDRMLTAAAWPPHLPVAIPTIPQRAPVLAASLAAWRALGASPVVTAQPAAWPLCARSQTLTAQAAIRAAIAADPAASHVLYAEDGAVPSPDLPARLPAVAATGETVALWSSAFSFLPAATARILRAGLPLPRRETVRATGISRWFGSVALLLPAGDAVTLSELPAVPGFDIHLRTWLLACGAPLLVEVPNLAQHARGKRYATRGGPAVVESRTFGWPVQEQPC
jgi:hypothetical protein